MSREFSKGDKVWTAIIDGTQFAEVEIVKVVRHKGEVQYVVEIRDAPDLVLAVRPPGALHIVRPGRRRPESGALPPIRPAPPLP